MIGSSTPTSARRVMAWSPHGLSSIVPLRLDLDNDRLLDIVPQGEGLHPVVVAGLDRGRGTPAASARQSACRRGRETAAASSRRPLPRSVAAGPGSRRNRKRSTRAGIDTYLPLAWSSRATTIPLGS